MAHATKNTWKTKSGKIAAAAVISGAAGAGWVTIGIGQAQSTGRTLKPIVLVKTTEAAGQKEFPLSDAAPIPFTRELPPQTSVPLSRIFQDAAGNSEATRAVNAITSVSPLPTSSSGGDTWLGTQYGVKRLRANTKTVRYYTQADGLPGDYVEAVSADARSGGAWCLVRVANKNYVNNGMSPGPRSVGSLAFCAWNAQTDTWRVVREITGVPSSNNDGYNGGYNNGYNSELTQAIRSLDTLQGRSLMTNSPNFVVFAPRIVSRAAEAPVYLWDKKRGQVRPISWESTEQSNLPSALGINFLWMDEARQTLWVGTSRGLQSCHLPDGKWRTFFPDRSVSAGAVTLDETALYLSCGDKAAPPVGNVTITGGVTLVPRNLPPNGNAATPAWRLVRVAVASGESTEMPPLPLPPPPSAGGGPRYYPSTNRSLFSREPVGLFVDERGSVWATLGVPTYTITGDDYGYGGLNRFDPAAQTWQHVPIASSRFPIRRGTPVTRRNAPGVMPSGGDPLSPAFPPTIANPAALPPANDTSPDAQLALLDTVPDAALLPLTLTAPASPYGGEGYSGYSGQILIPPSSPAYWISHRFPQWYGAADAQAESVSVPFNPRSVAADVNPDGTKNEERVWFVHNSDTLTLAPRADLGPNGGVTQGPINSYSIAPRVSADARYFPLEASFSTLRARVLRMVRADAQNPALLLVQSDRSLFLVDTSKNDWTEIRLGNNNGDTYGTALLPSAANGVPLFHTSSNGSGFVLRWNPVTKAFETAADLPVPKNAVLLGPGENGGVWFMEQNGYNGVWYQAQTAPTSITPTAPIKVAPNIPDEWAAPDKSTNGQRYSPRAVGAEGSRAWFMVLVRRSFFPSEDTEITGSSVDLLPCLAGYDRGTQKWTAPLPLTRNGGGEMPALLHAQNQTYVGTTAGNANGGVWKWNDATETWDVIAPALPLEGGFFDDEASPLRRPVVPVSVDEKYVWVMVMGRMMARYDRAAQKWETATLPPALRDKPNTSYSTGRQPKVVQTGPTTFCVGSEKGGLWRVRVGVGQQKGTLAAVWEPVGRQSVVRSRPDLNTGTTFQLNQVTVTPRYVWAIGYHQTEGFAFPARLDKTTKTWTVWDDKSGFPMREHPGSVTADGDTVWITSDSGTYRFDPAANRWTLMFKANDYSARVPEQAAPYKGEDGRQLTGRVRRITGDEKFLYLLLSQPEPNAAQNILVWRWDKAAQTLEPLPLPTKDSAVSRGISGLFLLNEPNGLWMGTNEGLFAWDKKGQKWSDILPIPAGFAPIHPQTIARGGEALVLTGNIGSDYNNVHVIRLVSPPFLKRP